MADTRVEPHDQAERHDPIYDRLHATPEFQELKKRHTSFVLPATIAFLSWYLLYVVMSMWAHDFMSQQVVGNINVALVFGLLQFVTTFLIAWLYARYMTAKVDPLARELEAEYRRRCRVDELRHPDRDPLRRRRPHHGRHHLLGEPPDPRRDGLLRRRPLVQRLPERHGHLGRLHVRGVVPRHLRRHRAERVRRVPLLHRLPRRLARGAAAGGRAAAELRPLHDGRPAGVPDAATPRAYGGGDLDRRRLDLLPARPDGRRGCARRAAARRHRRVREGLDHRGRRPADGLLRDRRRHEGHHLGADRQGRPADGRHDPDHGPGAGGVQLQPVQPARRRGREHRQGRGLPAARPEVRRLDHVEDRLRQPRHRPGARHGGPAAHPHPLLHRADGQGRADVRALGHRPDRRVLPDDAGAGLRCRRAAEHGPGQRGRRLRRQPGLAAARRVPRRW